MAAVALLTVPAWAADDTVDAPPSGEAAVAATDDGRPPGEEAAPTAEEDKPKLNSNEQGQAPLTEAFGTAPAAPLPRRPVLAALRATTFRVQLRTFFFDRDPLQGDNRSALATGGSVGFRTGHLFNRVALAATGYTSQKVVGPDDEDGSGLLQPGQKGYTVLGEAYAEVLLADGIAAHLGRVGVDTPYINRSDSRMTPNTFEAYFVRGVFGGKDGGPEFRMGVGYVDQIKRRNSTNFLSMAQVAGAPPGVARGVFVGGGVLRWRDVTIGAANYYSDDILYTLYTEATWTRALADPWHVGVRLQYSDQRSTGRDLLTGEHFETGQYGVKAEAGSDLLLLTMAFTGVREGDDMRSPWGTYPGYTSVQVRDFKRRGEEAFMLRLASHVPWFEGLSVYGLWVKGTDPRGSSLYPVQEWDLNTQWDLSTGIFDGLSLRLRYAHVEQDGGGSPNSDDFRMILTYGPPPPRLAGPQ